jgi:Domain of unknown function (DUF4412)
MRLVLFCLTLAATPALAADFEGIITGKPIRPSEQLQSVKMYLSATGVRMEATGIGQTATKGGAGYSVTTVWQASEPNNVYLLNPANQTYLKHDISKVQTPSAAESPKVERLGSTTFLGHTVQRAKVTFSTGRAQELWVDTSLHFPASALALFGQERGGQNSPWKALEKAGLTGIPLKDMDIDGKSGWEATSVEKKSLPASLFQIPPGYHEAKNALDMLPPEQQAQMKAKMDSMTPEQRAKLEEAMKKLAQ